MMQLLIQQAVFTDFRPIFILLLVISLVFLGLSLVPRGRNSNLNFLTILIISIVEILIAGMLLYTENNLAKIVEMNADKVTFYIFTAIFIISVINPILFRSRNQQSRRYRYRG